MIQENEQQFTPEELEVFYQKQIEMSKKLDHTDQKLPKEIKTVAGCDVAYNNTTNRLVAVIALLDAETLETIEIVSITDDVQFPYIPGLFSFRELPPILKALKKLSQKPDLIVCDGQGYAHPRRFGLACHLGLESGISTVGCAKTRLSGDFEDPALERGSMSVLVDCDETIGMALRTQDGVRPLFISVGNAVSLDTACKWVLKFAAKFRQPETTRVADQVVRKEMKILEENSEFYTD